MGQLSVQLLTDMYTERVACACIEELSYLPSALHMSHLSRGNASTVQSENTKQESWVQYSSNREMKVASDQFISVMLGVAPIRQLKQTTDELTHMAVQSIPAVVIFTALTQMWRTAEDLMKCLWHQLRQVGITVVIKTVILALQISFSNNSWCENKSCVHTQHYGRAQRAVSGEVDPVDSSM